MSRPDNTNPLKHRVKPRGGSATMAHVDPDRDEVNFFPTNPWGGRAGAEIIREIDPRATVLWEPASGSRSLVHGLQDYFPTVHASDKYLYFPGDVRHDFVGGARPPFRAQWIVTNAPFDPAEDFVRVAYEQATRGVAMLLRTGFLEGQTRYDLLTRECPLTFVAPFCERLPIVKGRIDPKKSSAAFYSWFFFLKPVLRPRRFMVRWPDGRYEPGVRFIPPGTRDRLIKPSDRAFMAMEAA